MATTFFFYDLETSGFSPKEARIVQFAGVRTDMELNEMGELHNHLIRLSDDIVPDPDATLITGITPQKTISEGLHEAEFLKIFHQDISRPNTIFVGYNTVRFDDEFMRYLQYRNFYDAYEWQWKDNRSRWDLLDVVRMTRALRPAGIQWPFDSKGNPTNRLELLASLNKLEHENAHDALSDVRATIAVARLIRGLQPKLFDFLLQKRHKNDVSTFVTEGKPFLYTSGKYPSEFQKTTAVAMLAEHPPGQAALVFDLRHNPQEFAQFDAAALAEAMRWRPRDDPGPRLPVKTLKYNRCPAIAPLSVLDQASQERLQLDPKIVQQNFQILQQVKAELAPKVLQALDVLDKKQQARLLNDEAEADTRLYDGFFAGQDKTHMSLVRAGGADELSNLNVTFQDDRLEALLPLYKARNFPKSLSDEERATWERHRERKLLGGGNESRMAKFFARLDELQTQPNLTGEQKYLLEELQLYAQSIMPVVD